MRVDLYTKVVLTGILGCLVWLCATVAPVATPVPVGLDMRCSSACGSSRGSFLRDGIV